MGAADREDALTEFIELQELAQKHSPEFVLQLPYATTEECAAWLKLLRHIDAKGADLKAVTRADFESISAEFSDPVRLANALKAAFAKAHARRTVRSTLTIED